MHEFLEMLLKFIAAYCAFGLGFYCSMVLQGFWKTKEIKLQIFYSFFWPVSIVAIYIALKKRKEEKDNEQ